MNSLLLSVVMVNKNKYAENGSKILYKGSGVHRGEHIQTGASGTKWVSECKAMQHLKTSAGDPGKIREWGEKLLNTLAEVCRSYPKALKNLNSKLETMGGVLDEDEGNMARIFSGR
eukprot:7787360-Pyramimonas_sp.AAC.1